MRVKWARGAAVGRAVSSDGEEVACLGRFPSVLVKSVDLFSQLRMPQIMAAVLPIPCANVVDLDAYAKCKCVDVAARTADAARH